MMLSPAFTAAGSHLSPSAQATLNKHLPTLSAKRLVRANSSNLSEERTKTNSSVVQTVEASCLTDICIRDNLPEVEIFSLLEEKLPKYRVRADFLTDFSGYANNDWYIKAPALDVPDKGLGLTKEQARETLHYFLLCGNRVSQMTRAYNDIEAVTRLLEEKEKDLELTVQIGKDLLTQNHQLESRINELESDLKSTQEDRTQLLHELHKKNELISVLTNDVDETSDNDTPTYSKSITLDLLQTKIDRLQDENKSLKMEATQLACETDAVEAQERKLMNDLTTQLNEANRQYEGLCLELERQREENQLQHEQIVNLTARLTDTELRLHQLSSDNNDHLTLLNITKENQNSLAMELVEFKQRYQEVLSLLHDAQTQLKRQRKKAMPQVRSLYMGATANVQQADSLQSELMELSMYSENSLDSGISGDHLLRMSTLANQKQHSQPRNTESELRMYANINNINNVIMDNPSNYSSYVGSGIYRGTDDFQMKSNYKGASETIRCASKAGHFTNSDKTEEEYYTQKMDQGVSLSSCNVNATPRLSVMELSNSTRNVGINSCSDLEKTLSYESLCDFENTYAPAPVGVPGTPGAKELEAAIRRLTPAEVLARRAMLSHAPAGTYSYEETTQSSLKGAPQPGLPPLGIRTPESIMSTGGSSSGILSAASNFSSTRSSFMPWRLPQKLQIIKPVEGSQTLHQWSCLATPTLGGLLEERPGVTIRGGRDLEDLGMQLYTLSDLEEDAVSDLPGKQFEASGCTYTYTNSVVMHPDDGILNDASFLSQSQLSSRFASTSTSRQPSCPPTPRAGGECGLSRKNSCSTFSVNLGLASMLNERGIKAVSPSALNTPVGSNYSPTVTPCNSPEGSLSPNRSMSPEPLFSGLLSSGAYLLRRKLIGGDLERSNSLHQQQQKQRLERRALRSLRLVEKVESIGLENIIKSPPNPMSQLANGIVNRSASPMAQLTSLKNMPHHKHQQQSLKANIKNANLTMLDGPLVDREMLHMVDVKGLNIQTTTSKLMNPSIAKIAARKTRMDESGDESSSSALGEELQRRDNNQQRLPLTHANLRQLVSNTDLNSTSGSDEDTLAFGNGIKYSKFEGSLAGINGNERIKQMKRQRSRRQLKNGQRQDLGKIESGGGGRIRTDLGQVASTSSAANTVRNLNDTQQHQSTEQVEYAANQQREQKDQQTLTQSVVGTFSSLLFGRKGGWL